MSEQEPIVRRLGIYAQSGTGVCTAVHEALTRSDASSRYWTLDSYAGTVEATTAVVLRCTSTNARLVLRANNAASTVLCSYHPAPNVEGETEEAIDLSATLDSNLTSNGSPELKLTSNSATYTLTNSYAPLLSVGATPSSGFMIEMEDAITIVLQLSNRPSNWGFSCHAGVIMSPDNLSDASYGVDGSGIMCGFYGVYADLGWAHTTAAYNTASRIRVGPNAWEQVNIVKTSPPIANYVVPTNIAPIGDAGNVERLVPWRLYGETGGVLGSMRYLRQRYLNKAAVTTPALASGHLTDISNNVVAKNDKVVLGSNPNIAWIHQIPFDTAANLTQQNLVHIWNNNGYVS